MKPLYLLLLSLLSLLPWPAAAQTVNVDAAERYWEMTDALRRDQPLTDNTWNAFVAVPANRRYIASVFSEKDLKSYRRAIEVIYRPSLDSLRQARLKAESWYYVLNEQYRQREPEFRAYLQQTAQQPGYLDLMYQLAYEYLPAPARHPVANLQLAYVAIGNDAISEQEGLVFSLKSAIDWNKPKAGILEGHEIHHQLRPGLDFSFADSLDQTLLYALNMSLNEGLADLIDKSVFMRSPADSAETRSWLLAGAPAVLQATAAWPTAPRPELRYYRRLSNGSNGHLPGFFMARTIERNGLRPQLLAASDDPMAFFLLYQRAARRDKTRPPTFSGASVAYLKSLQKKYVAPARQARVRALAP
ncbi:hypothetical protein D0N36_10135 [Hymenobacter lapidiphilus]|uniref:DUF5700 domain-containing putative Zn-dependent protease n=1 Tax=Hymenobacter sp. CCM 8763 TaxID=2303334 RepID=UPI000E34F590|nr:DUF5700 domain-containing putative Zn-dependent protease [Hymenobacter sp. CCM 8763]RFP65211.1 hypothetical protein D0N36_10135 [Hymenobacter sp. CCM 8763]